MKLFQIPVIVASMALSAALVRANGAWIPNPSGFEIRRGVNLSHWLSQCPRELDKNSYIKDADFELIHRIGYDHVRIPIDEIELWSSDGHENPATFKLLTWALDECQKHGLRAIVDLHTVRTHHFNSEYGPNTLWTHPAAQVKFLKLWTDLSGALRSYPVDRVAYEILNEPVAKNPKDWNRLVAKSIGLIRAREPNRVLIVGSNRWDSASTFRSLKIPANDRNIILTVHDYLPFPFTHHLANWTDFKDYRGPVHYPGPTIAKKDLDAIRDKTLRKHLGGADRSWDRARLLDALRPAIERAREFHLQLYCGEFGCLPTVPRADRLAWYTDMISVLESNHVAWANWEYKADFGIVPYDFRHGIAGAPDDELIQILLGSSPK